MTPKEFYQKYPNDKVEAVARAAGTSLGNFKQIAIAGGSVSKVLAERLAKASNNEMTELEILYPERYAKSA